MGMGRTYRRTAVIQRGVGGRSRVQRHALKIRARLLMLLLLLNDFQSSILVLPNDR